MITAWDRGNEKAEQYDKVRAVSLRESRTVRQSQSGQFKRKQNSTPKSERSV